MLFSKQETSKQIYRTAMYLRLSREDGDKSESDSIANQRALIHEYLKTQPNLCCVDEFSDDGYSGANFQRPAFTRMLEDVKSGAVNCIVMKDLSRFGRNYIDVGRYLEQIFPSLEVRVIAINDQYDSADKATSRDAIMLPIKNLMNDIYCRYISVKIKSQLDTKRRRGEFVGNFAVYDLLRDATETVKEKEKEYLRQKSVLEQKRDEAEEQKRLLSIQKVMKNADGSTYSGDNDPRVTKIGRIMRNLSIDELPQILNVLLGDMSFVGPRPHLATGNYEDMDEIHKKRLTVRPGITGYSQAYFRNSITQDEKMANDCYYVDHLISIQTDIRDTIACRRILRW